MADVTLPDAIMLKGINNNFVVSFAKRQRRRVPVPQMRRQLNEFVCCLSEFEVQETELVKATTYSSSLGRLSTATSERSSCFSGNSPKDMIWYE